MITIEGTEYHAIESHDCVVHEVECHFLAAHQGNCNERVHLCSEARNATRDVIFIHPKNYHLYVAARLKS